MSNTAHTGFGAKGLVQAGRNGRRLARLLAGTALVGVGMTLASPSAAQTVNPAGGGTVTTNGGTITGGGANQGVQVQQSGAGGVTVTGVTITNTGTTPTADGLRVIGAGGQGVGLNIAGTSTITSQTGDGVRLQGGNENIGFGVMAGQTLNVTGINGVVLTASGSLFLAAEGAGSIVATARTTGTGTGVLVTLGGNSGGSLGRVSTTGFATGIGMTGNGLGAIVEGGTINATTTGILVNASGNTVLDSRAAIVAPTGINATAANGTVITTSGGGTINAVTAGTGTGILANTTSGANETTVTVGAAIGGTTAFATGVSASTTGGTGVITVTNNSAITATTAIAVSSANAATINLNTGSTTTGTVTSTGAGTRTVTVAGVLAGAYDGSGGTGATGFTLASTGSMQGATFGSGSDTFTWNGGTIGGALNGGGGANTLNVALGTGVSRTLNGLTNFGTRSLSSGNLTLQGTLSGGGSWQVSGGALTLDTNHDNGGGTFVSLNSGTAFTLVAGRTLSQGNVAMSGGTATINGTITLNSSGGTNYFGTIGTSGGTINVAATGRVLATDNTNLAAINSPFGGTFRVNNSGLISGGTVNGTNTTIGIRTSSGTLTVANQTASSIIRGVQAGIATVNTAALVLTNAGSVVGATDAINAAGTGATMITNETGGLIGVGRIDDGGVFTVAASGNAINGGGALTVTNAGDILGIAVGSTTLVNGSHGVLSSGVLTLTNQNGGRITGGAVGVRTTGGGSITNAGLITGNGPGGVEVGDTSRNNPITVTNQNGGTIRANGAASTAGVLVNNTATVINQSGAVITGEGTNGGIYGRNTDSTTALTVTNGGRIVGTTSTGIENVGTGTIAVGGVAYTTVVTNQAGGVVVGAARGLSSGSAAVSNAGTIGTGTVNGMGAFVAGGTDTAVVVGGGSVFNSGTINGAGGGVKSTSSDLITLVNTGTITSRGVPGNNLDALFAQGSASVLNAGMMTAARFAGIFATGSADITNAAGGMLTGGDGGPAAGVGVHLAGGGSFLNYGAASSAGGLGVYSGANIASTVSLAAGSSTGAIQLAGGNDTLSLFNGQVNAQALTTTRTDPVTSTVSTITLQNAGTLAAATFGAIDLGGGTDTLVLRGTGAGGVTGAAGSFSIATSTGAEVLRKLDAGTWTLTGAAITPGIAIQAGDGGNNDGVLIFNGTTGLTGAIIVNGAIIRSASSGAFGTGTITTIDPTIQYAATTTENNEIVLASVDPTGDPTILQTFGTGITATLNGRISQQAAAAQPLRFRSTDANGVQNTGTFVLTNGANDYAGLTTIETGTTVVERNTASALGTGGVNILTGGVLQFDNTDGVDRAIEAGSYNGAGTIRFTATSGATVWSLGNAGIVTFSLASGGLIDIVGGTVNGSASGEGFWTGNLGDMTIASGATFDTVEAVVQVDALNGGGILQGGFAGPQSFIMGVDNGSGTFSGIVRNSPVAGGGTRILALEKSGTGTQTLSGALTYTGGTTIAGGTLRLQNNTLPGNAIQIDAAGRLEYNLTTPNTTIGQNRNTTLTGTGVFAITGGVATSAVAWRGSFQMSAGGQLRVETGRFVASSDVEGVWTNNLGDLFVGSTAQFATAEARARFDKLTGTGTVQIDGSGSLTLGVSGGTAQFDGVIQNQATAGTVTTGTLTKIGAGTQTLTGVNTYTGGTIITGGTLALSGAGSIANSALVTNNAIFDISGITAAGTSIVNLNGTATTANVALGAKTLTITNGSGSYAGSITGTGGLTVNGAGTLQLAGTGNTYSGTTTIGAGETLQGTTATLSPNSTYVDNGTLAFVQAADGTFTRNVSGTGGITVSGLATGNTLTFTGALTQQGAQANGSPLRVLDSSNVTLAQGSSLIPVAAQNNAVSLLAAGTFTNLGTVNSAVGSQAIFSLNNTTGGGIINNGSATVTGASLVGGDRGIFYSGGTASVTVNNSGLIQGGRTNGIQYQNAGTLTLVNNASAAIYGAGTLGPNYAGVAGLNGAILTITNAGQIVGRDFGVSGVSATDSVINTGTISTGSYTAPAGGAAYSTGTIALGAAGNGIYLIQGGTVTNAVGATIAGGNTGIDSRGNGALRVTNNGTITGGGTGNGVGFFSTAAAAGTLTNTGTISINNAVAGNDSWGVGFFNNGTVVTNTGSIRGDKAIEAQASGTIINGATGTLAGLTNAIRTSGTGTLGFTNYGTATGAIAGGSSGVATIVLQSGSTTGAITTGTGNDTLTLYNGLVTPTTVTDPATGLTLRGAGTFAPVAVGAINLGGGTNTLVLRGTGDDTAANGTGGTLNLSTVSNVTALTKEDSGRWTLTGASAIAGTTAVNAGTLVVNATTGSPTTVAAGATLTGAGSIGATTIADGGILAGAQGSTLTMASLDLTAGSIINAAFTGTGGVPLFAATGNLTLDGTVNVASTGAFGIGVYRLASYGGTLTDNGLVIGTQPADAQRFGVQTSVAGQVNLVNAPGMLLFWDGGNAGLYNNGAIDGGTGTWTATSPTFTDTNGQFNGAMFPQPGFAVFQAAPGTVTVDGSAGAIAVTGLQFASDGYVVIGDAIGLAAPTTAIRVGDGSAAGAGFTATIGAVLSGANGLDKTDLGSLVLTGANSFTGPTTITAGTLVVDGSTVSATTVMSGAILTGGGSVGATVVADGGTLVGVQGRTLTLASLGLSAGSVIDATFSAPGGAALFGVTGDLVLDGTVNVASTGAFGFGVYRLASYGGVLTDNGLVVGTTPAGAQRTTVQTAVAGQVNLVSSSSELSFWDGGNAALYNNGAVDGGTGSWTATAPTFTDANGLFNGPMTPQPGFAVFQAAAGTVTVDGSAGAIAVTGMQFAADGYVVTGDAIGLAAPTTAIRVGDGTAAGAAFTATIGSALTGANGLDKTDLGTLILTGTNSYAGATTVSGGTLVLAGGQAIADGNAVQVGAAGTLTLAASERIGTVGGAGAVVLGANTLALGAGSSVYTGVASGTGGITVDGGGMLTLAGANSYTGTTQVTGATLVFGASNVLADASTLSLAGATATLGANSDTVAVLIANNAVLDGTGTLTAARYTLGGSTVNANLGGGTLANTGGASVLNGMAAATAVNVDGGSLSLGASNRLADTAVVTVASGGTLNIAGFTDTVGTLALTGTLDGTGTLSAASYTLTGGTANANLGAGTLVQASGASTLNGTAGATAVNVTGGTLSLGASNRLADGAAVSVASGGTLNIAAFTDTVGSLALAGTLNGTGTLTAATYTLTGGTANANLGAGTLLQASGASTLNGSSAASTLTVSGGSLRLNGTAAATTVAVNAGSLSLGASNRLADTAAVSVASGAILDLAAFSDTVGSLALGGTLNGSGTLSAASYTLNAGTVNANLGAGTLTTTGGVSTLNGTAAAATVNVTAGTLRLGAANRLADASAVTVASGAILDLAAFGDTVGTLALGGTLNGSGTLSAASYTLNAATVNANLGAGTLTQAGGVSTLAGSAGAATVNVTAGTLRLAGDERLVDTSAVTIAGGATFDLNGRTETVATLTGTGTTALGAGRLVLAGAAASSLGALTGTGNVDKTGTGTLTLANAYASTGSINTAAGTTVFTGSSAGSLRVTGGTLTGTGTAAGTLTLTGGTVSPGVAGATNGTQFGTLSVGGLTASGGAYAIDFGGAASGFASDLIRVAGTAALSGTVAVAPVSFAGNDRFQQTYTIIQANAVTGTFANGQAFSAVGNDGSLFYRLRYDLVPNAVVLQVQRQIDFRAVLAPGTVNQRAVAGALNGAAGLASDSFAGTLNAIAGSGGNRGATFDSLSGEAITDVTSDALFASDLFVELMRARIGVGRSTQDNAQYALRAGMAGDTRASGFAGQLQDGVNADGGTAGAQDGAGVWLQGYGAGRRLRGLAGQARTNSFVDGLAGGIDGRFGNVTLGLAGGFSTIDTSVRARNSQLGGTLYQGGGYVAYEGTNLYGSVSGSYYQGDVTVTRQLALGGSPVGRATGTPQVDGYAVGGLLGVRFEVGGGTQAGIEVKATQTRATRDAYTETAPLGLNLTAQRDARDVFSGTAQVKLAHRYTGNGWTATPYAAGGVRFNSGDLDTLGTMQFGGAPTGTGGFIVQGATLERTTGVFTGGIEIRPSDKFRIDLSAGGAIGNRTREGQIKVSARLGF